MATTTVQLVIADGRTRSDVTAPAEATVREVLTASGYDPDEVEVIRSDGSGYELDRHLAAQARPGSLLWVHRSTRSAARTRQARRPRPAPVARYATRDGFALAGAALLAVSVSLVAFGGSPAGDAGAGIGATVSGALLGLAALGLFRHRALGAALAAPLLAFLAGFVMTPSALTGSAPAIVVGLVVGAATACVRHGLATRRLDRWAPVTAAIALIWSIVAILATATFMLGAPLSTTAGVILALVPLAIRTAIRLALTVPEEDLLDLPYLARESSSVRGVEPRRPRAVRKDQIEGAIGIAKIRADVAMVLTCVLSLVSAPMVLTVSPAGGLWWWFGVGAVLALSVLFALCPRSWRQPVSRSAARLTAIGLAAVAVATVAMGAPETTGWLLLVFAVSGAIAASVAPRLARGWRSVAWSRVGDFLERLTVLVIPIGSVLASGLTDEIARLTS